MAILSMNLAGLKLKALALSFLVLSVSASPLLPRGSSQAYASNEDGSLKLSSYNAPTLNGGSQPSGVSKTWQLTVDDTSSGHKQSITGFGAAITDSTTSVYNSLSSSQQNQFMQDLFSSDGAAFSLMRHTIGASDLSPNEYTYEDNQGSFGLGASGQAMTSFISTAKSVQPDFMLLGTPWSAPGWMKLNGVLTGNTDNNNLNDNDASDFANLFVDYLQAYESAGAHVDAITIQNEPLNSQAGYMTMYVADTESAGLIQNNVGPAIANAGLSTKVWAYDHNTDQPSYPQTVLDNAGQYVDTVAWHCYANPLDWSVLTDFHNSNPGATQYMTECWTSPDTAWNWAADFTAGPLQNWASGAMAWVLSTDTSYGPHFSGGCSDCRGLVVVDTSAGTYELQVDYYMMAQFSKFMPRGAIVLNGTGSYDYGNGQKVEAVATLNPDGTRTIVVENLFTDDIWLSVSMDSGEGTWNGQITGSGVTTWVLPPTS